MEEINRTLWIGIAAIFVGIAIGVLTSYLDPLLYAISEGVSHDVPLLLEGVR